LAAHQYLCATEGQGYLDQNGKPFLDNRDQLVTLGMALITYLNQTKHA